MTSVRNSPPRPHNAHLQESDFTTELAESLADHLHQSLRLQIIANRLAAKETAKHADRSASDN